MENWVHDPEGAGRRIVQAVGLPLISDVSLAELASRSITSLYVAELSGDRKRSAEQKRQRRQEGAIATRVGELIHLLDRYFEGSELKSHKQILAAMREIDVYFPTYSGEEINQTDSVVSFGILAHNTLTANYRRYFRVEPAFTYSETQGYPGPFWNYVRIVREIAGMNFTEEAIRKAHTRLNQRAKKATKGQTVLDP